MLVQSLNGYNDIEASFAKTPEGLVNNIRARIEHARDNMKPEWDRKMELFEPEAEGMFSKYFGRSVNSNAVFPMKDIANLD